MKQSKAKTRREPKRCEREAKPVPETRPAREGWTLGACRAARELAGSEVTWKAFCRQPCLARRERWAAAYAIECRESGDLFAEWLRWELTYRLNVHDDEWHDLFAAKVSCHARPVTVHADWPGRFVNWLAWDGWEHLREWVQANEPEFAVCEYRGYRQLEEERRTVEAHENMARTAAATKDSLRLTQRRGGTEKKRREKKEDEGGKMRGGTSGKARGGRKSQAGSSAARQRGSRASGSRNRRNGAGAAAEASEA